MKHFNMTATRHPMAVGPIFRDKVPEGTSIAEIVAMVPDWVVGDVPRDQLIVTINGRVVPAEIWAITKPRVVKGVALPVSVHPPVQGGDSGGKAVLGAVASIAILAVAAFAAPAIAALAGAKGTFAFAATKAAVLAAGSSVAALAASALSAPPAAQARAGFIAEEESGNAEIGSAFAQANTAQPGGPIPACVGRRKVFPPAIVFPLIEIRGDDEFVEVAYALNGPHDGQNIRVLNTLITEIPGVDYEVREGWDTDQSLSLVRRYSKTLDTATKLIKHDIDPDNPERIATPTTPDESLPRWHQFSTVKDADEIWLALIWDKGLIDPRNDDTFVAMPVRFRMREKGETEWKNLPEVHFTASSLGTLRKQIKIKWANAPVSLPTPPTTKAPYVAFKVVPGQNGSSASPETDGWTAHNHFDDGLPGIDSAANVALYQDRVEFFLDEANFPRGKQYEIEVIRGVLYTKGFFDTSDYTTGGPVLDFFSYDTVRIGFAAVVRSQEDVVDDLILSRVSSVFNRNPVQEKGFWLLALKGKNIDVRDVSAEALRWVKDWDGTGWTKWALTNNPAPHFRDVLTGAQTHPRARFLSSEIGDEEILAWRDYCTDNDHEVRAIVDGRSMTDVLNAITSVAFGRPRRWDTVGLVVDRKRTNELEAQIFTPLNAGEFGWEKPFANAPDGYRIKYVDESEDWASKEIEVFHPDVVPENATLIEAVSYDSMVDREKITKRASFDLQQIRVRNTTYSLRTDAEHLACRRGNIVGLANDILIERSAQSRIVSITRDVGTSEITQVEFQSEIEFDDNPDFWSVPDFWAEPDVWAIGLQTHGIVRLPTGGTASLGKLTGLGGVARSKIAVLAEPRIDANIKAKQLVVFGPAQEQYKRVIVVDVIPAADLTAKITMVDETPDIHPQEVVKLSGTALVTVTVVADAPAPLVGVAQVTVTVLDLILWDNGFGWDNGLGWQS